MGFVVCPECRKNISEKADIPHCLNCGYPFNADEWRRIENEKQALKWEQERPIREQKEKERKQKEELERQRQEVEAQRKKEIELEQQKQKEEREKQEKVRQQKQEEEKRQRDEINERNQRLRDACPCPKSYCSLRGFCDICLRQQYCNYDHLRTACGNYREEKQTVCSECSGKGYTVELDEEYGNSAFYRALLGKKVNCSYCRGTGYTSRIV